MLEYLYESDRETDFAGILGATTHAGYDKVDVETV